MSILHSSSKDMVTHITTDMTDSAPLIPHVEFKESSGLQRLIHNLQDFIEIKLPGGNDTSNAPAIIIAQVANQLDALKADSAYTQYFAPFSRTANMISQATITAFNIIRDSVGPEAKVLREAILAERDKILASEGNILLINPEAKPTIPFTNIDWDVINVFGGSSEVLEQIREYAPVVGMEVTRTALRNLVSRTPIALDVLELSEENLTDIARRVKERAPSLADEDITNFVVLVTKQQAFHSFLVNNQFVDVPENPAVDQVCRTAVTLLNTLPPIMEALNRTELDLSEESLATIGKNIKMLRGVLMVYAAFLIYARHYYRAILVIDAGWLNPDELPKLEAAGGTQQDAADHIAAFYSALDIRIPSSGIPTSSVLDRRALAAADLVKIQQQKLMNSEIIISSATNRATKMVLISYLKSTDPSRLPEGVSLDQFVTQQYNLVEFCVSSQTRAGNSLEDALFEFVIKCWHPVYVFTIHNLFRKVTLMNIEHLKDLTPPDISKIYIHVAAIAIVDCLLEQFCDID